MKYFHLLPLLCWALPVVTMADDSKLAMLECRSPSHYASFIAGLDYTHFDAGSGLFGVTGANIVFEYSNARLICEGYRPNEIKCVGLWNGGLEDEIVEVRTFDADCLGERIKARFVTSKSYGSKSITLNCHISHQQ